MATKSERHFCGFVCYGAWQKIHRVGFGREQADVVCHTCKKTFEKDPSAVVTHNFCSRDCYAVWRSTDDWCGANNPSWLGGHSQYRGPNWKRQSRAARCRDQNTCQNCGLVAWSLPVHHIRPFSLFDDYREANRIENLATLCPECHMEAECAFWEKHPELIALRKTFFLPVVACQKCNRDFLPRSGASTMCDACCSAICAHCNTAFYSRRAVSRTIKYCSRRCRNSHLSSHMIPRRKSSLTT
jgi:hypothetical protein